MTETEQLVIRGEIGFESHELLTIIKRLSSPRAVLDEAERLLRERKVFSLDLEYPSYGDGPVERCHLHSFYGEPDRDPQATSLVAGPECSMSDAYEVLVGMSREVIAARKVISLLRDMHSGESTTKAAVSKALDAYDNALRASPEKRGKRV